MERTGEVKEINGAWLTVEFCRPKDCEKCNACHGGQKVMTARVRGQAEIGDRVVVSLPAATVTRASAIVYAVPLAGLLLGMALGNALLPLADSLGALIGGAAGIGLAAAGVALTERTRRDDPRWQPQLVRVLPKGQNEA